MCNNKHISQFAHGVHFALCFVYICVNYVFFFFFFLFGWGVNDGELLVIYIISLSCIFQDPSFYHNILTPCIYTTPMLVFMDQQIQSHLLGNPM